MLRCEADADWGIIDENQYSALVYEIYRSLTDVYGFYIAYVEELIDDEAMDLIGTDADNIEPCLMQLAASKIEIDEKFATKFSEFRFKVRKDYKEWLTLVKDKAFRAGVPLRAELMDMVHDSHASLGEGAEAEALGFNSSRLHPDVYMNELLVGMRVIHQVLPAIMRRLGIYDEFKLETSELRNDSKFGRADVDGVDDDNSEATGAIAEMSQHDDQKDN